MKTSLSLILFLLTLGSVDVFAGGKLTWAWHEPGFDLFSPQFSTAGDEIVIVRQRHISGGEGEDFSPERLKKAMEPIEKDKRYADPEVVILAIGKKSDVTRLDWGWDPTFSPDGREIAYAFQKLPISGFRGLAETMAGNDIRIYQRDGKAIRTIATPAFGYLAAPIFSPDGKQVVYSLASAINGAWGGNIGIGRGSIDGTGGEILYPATKDFGLYHLIPKKLFVGTRLVALREKPLSGGEYVANSYLNELLEVGPPTRKLFAWKIDDDTEERPTFGCAPQGQLLVHEKVWRKIDFEKTNTITVMKEKAPGTISPDGRLVAVRRDSGVEVRDLPTHQSVAFLKIKDEIQAVSWSSDSQRLAIVSTKQFQYDELSVFTISR